MSAETRKKLVQILLVEDNPGDVRLTREALRDDHTNHLTWTSDGVEALACLHREGKYADAPRPDLILLDLSLPRKDGREVLAEIKQDPELRRIRWWSSPARTPKRTSIKSTTFTPTVSSP